MTHAVETEYASIPETGSLVPVMKGSVERFVTEVGFTEENVLDTPYLGEWIITLQNI